MEQQSWKPVTMPASTPDPRGPGIDFVLTPQERDRAVLAQLFLIDRRNRLNQLDRQQTDAQAARELAEALRERVL